MFQIDTCCHFDTLVPHERRERIPLHQFPIGHRLRPSHPAHGLLEWVRILAAVEPVAELIQIPLEVLY
jgi:hypothetical protein